MKKRTVLSFLIQQGSMLPSELHRIVVLLLSEAIGFVE
jgi:hypothetical protein